MNDGITITVSTLDTEPSQERKRTRNFANMDEGKNNFLKKAKINEIYRYDCPDHQVKIHHLIKRGTQINFIDYVDYPVIYMFIVPLKRDHQDVVVKIGYSADICDRIKTLKDEYKSDIYLIGLKLIRSEKIENNFHKLLHEAYPENVEEMQINGKNKLEMYKLSEKIIAEFDAVREESIKKNYSMGNNFVRDEQINYVKNQYDSFIDPMIDPVTDPIIDLTIDPLTDSMEIFYDSSSDIPESDMNLRPEELRYMSLMEKFKHERIMKDKEIELKKLELALRR